MQGKNIFFYNLPQFYYMIKSIVFNKVILIEDLLSIVFDPSIICKKDLDKICDICRIVRQYYNMAIQPKEVMPGRRELLCKVLGIVVVLWHEMKTHVMEEAL